MKTATVIQFRQKREDITQNTCDLLTQEMMACHRHAPVILVGMAIGAGVRAIQNGKEYHEARVISEDRLRSLIVQNLDTENRERFLMYRYKLNHISTNHETEE